MSEAIFIIGDGRVTALAGGPLSLADLGPRTTRRVSRVEFNAAADRWEVLDAVDSKLPPRFSSKDYDECLRWEADFFNAFLGSNPESAALR